MGISELKTRATSGVIDQVAEDSPNLLLYVGQEDSAVTATTTTTTFMPSGMWSVLSGPCLLDADGCVNSPNYPSRYANGQSCDIRANPAQAAPIAVEAFDTEANFDKLVVNEIPYSGNLGRQGGPHGVIPSGTIEWSSDYSIVKTGWKLCAATPVTTAVATTTTTTIATTSSTTPTTTTTSMSTLASTTTLSTTTSATTEITIGTTSTSTSSIVTTTTSTSSVTLSHALSTTVSTFIPDRLFDFLDANKDGVVDMHEWHRLR